MFLTEEDKIRYNLIEDNMNDKVIGSVESIINYLSDEIQYDLNNTDDEETIEQIKEVVKKIANFDRNMIIAIFDNPMCGLDWQLVEYNYI